MRRLLKNESVFTCSIKRRWTEIATFDIKGSGDFINGDYIKEKGITKFKIETEAEMVETKFGDKVECKVSFNGQSGDDPTTWQMNNTTAKGLQKLLGEDSKSWIGKTIPIEPSKTEKGYAIYLDEITAAKQESL